MHVKKLLFLFMSLIINNAKAQLNLSLSYNNRSIIYESAQGLNGLDFDVLYKTKTKGHFGLSFNFNHEITKKKEVVKLKRLPSDKEYTSIGYYFDYEYDSSAIYKYFNERKSYTYVALAFKHFKDIKSTSNSIHYLGYTLGVNILGEQRYVKSDSTNRKYFYKNATLVQIMAGVNYHREIMLNKPFSFIYGANISVSAMPLTLYDADFIERPIVSGSIVCGIRYYFRR